MRTLSNSDLLGLWERGADLHVLDCGLLALSAAMPEVSQGGLADAHPHAFHAEQTVRFKGESFRLPTSRDLGEAARRPDAETAALTVVERCRTGEKTTADWNAEDLEGLGNALAAADPLAEIRI